MNEAVGPTIEGLRFIKSLGQGGYSDVYLYERRSPTMNVAVKVLKADRFDANELAQFEAEAETMAELADHPNIVQVFSADRTAQGRPFLTMKYYPRPNMGVRAASERLSVSEALSVGIKIASAVETAHRAGILHRDIKPANILGDQYGEPGLTDFGIAGRTVDDDDGDNLGVSVPWSSPEVLTGTSNGSVSADIYGLAATLWHLLAGRSPFEVPGGDNGHFALVQRICSTPAPVTGRADVPASLERLLAHGLAKQAHLRPRTALELAQALQAVEQEQRLPRTRIVVEGLEHEVGTAPSRAPRREDEDRTRAKAPVRLQPQPSAPVITAAPSLPVPPVIASAPPSAKRADRQRVMPAGDAAGDTLRRPVAPVDEDVPRESRRGVTPRTVVLVASVVVVIAVAAGIVLASRSGGSSTPTTPSQRATGQTAALAPPPAPKVTASAVDGSKKVRFSWADSERSRGGTFVWMYENSSQPHNTSGSSVVLESGGRRVCIEVLYVDASNTQSPSSPPTCGGGS